MKWVIATGSGATQVYRMGWGRALVACGHEVHMWEPSAKPPNDLFCEQEFDAVMLGSWQLSKAFVRNAVERKTQVFLWVPNFGPYDQELDKNHLHDSVQRPSAEEIGLAEQLAKGGTTHCFSYYHERYINDTHGFWRNVGLEPVGLPLAADIITFPLTESDPNYAADATFVGGRWPVKSHCIDPYLFPLCHPSSGLSVKIFGSGHWPVPQHLGRVSDGLMSKFFASAKVCPCIFEPTSLIHHMDCSQRIYSVMSSGGFAISQNVRTVREDLYSDSDAVFCDSPKDFFEAVCHFVRRPEERQPYIRNGIRATYSRHTFFHRLSALFEIWGMGEESKKCQETLNGIISRNQKLSELLSGI